MRHFLALCSGCASRNWRSKRELSKGKFDGIAFINLEISNWVKVVYQKTGAKVGELAVNFTARVVTVSGARLHLSAREYRLLDVLSMNAGRVITHDQLLWLVWGPGYEGRRPFARLRPQPEAQDRRRRAASPLHSDGKPGGLLDRAPSIGRF